MNPNPMRFPIKPGIKASPGSIVKIVDYLGTQVIDICDGYCAIGILGNRCIGGNEVDFTKKAKVYPQRMVANIDRFDRIPEIGVGDSLYCNEKGILSTVKPFASAMLLAKVITPNFKKNQKRYMQILWL